MLPAAPPERQAGPAHSPPRPSHSYAINQASEWQDIAKEAVKAVVVMLVLERLYISSPLGWLEDHVDYLSVQVREVSALRQQAAVRSHHAPAVHLSFVRLFAGGDDAREPQFGRPHPQTPQILSQDVERMSRSATTLLWTSRWRSKVRSLARSCVAGILI